MITAHYGLHISVDIPNKFNEHPFLHAMATGTESDSEGWNSHGIPRPAPLRGNKCLFFFLSLLFFSNVVSLCICHFQSDVCIQFTFQCRFHDLCPQVNTLSAQNSVSNYSEMSETKFIYKRVIFILDTDLSIVVTTLFEPTHASPLFFVNTE